VIVRTPSLPWMGHLLISDIVNTHRHAACCLLHLKPRTLAKYSDFNISFVLQFMAFTAVFRGIFRPKNKTPKNKKWPFFGAKTKTKFGGPLAP